MNRFVGLSLFAAALLYADNPAATPASQLFHTGMQQIEQGNVAGGRATLANLLAVYPKDPLALQAKGAMDAADLLQEAQARLKAGKYDTARVAFRTLIAVYPESPLAARGKAALHGLEEKERSTARTVKAVEIRDVPNVPVEELRAAMDAREVRLSVGKPCHPKDVVQAKTALEEILVEKGLTNARVDAQTRAVSHDAVQVIFTFEKTHGSLLGAPWRLARNGLHHKRSTTPEGM